MAKFLFERSFEAGGAEAPPRKPPRPTFGEEDMVAAEAQGFERGRAAGREEAQRTIEAVAAQAMSEIAARIASCATTQGAALAECHRDAARLAFLIASKLAPALIEREPTAEIEALIGQCLAEHETEPRLVVRAAGPVVESISPLVDRLAAENGYAGRLVLLPDERLAAADCRVEWADGGMERNSASLMAAIDAAVARYIDAERPASGGRNDG